MKFEDVARRLLKSMWSDGIPTEDYGKAIAMVSTLASALSAPDERRKDSEPEEAQQARKWMPAPRIAKREGQQSEE